MTMSTPRWLVSATPVIRGLPRHRGMRGHCVPISPCFCRCQRHISRQFSSTTRAYRQADGEQSFGTRLRKALAETKIKWYPIPVGLGIGFLGLVQFYKVNEREKIRQREEYEENDAYVRSTGSSGDGEERDREDRPKKRKRIRPTGPWSVYKSWSCNSFLCSCIAGKSKSCPHSH